MFVLRRIDSKIRPIAFNCGLKLSRVRLRFACNRKWAFEPRKSSVEAILRDFSQSSHWILIKLSDFFFAFWMTLWQNMSWTQSRFFFFLLWLNVEMFSSSRPAGALLRWPQRDCNLEWSYNVQILILLHTNVLWPTRLTQCVMWYLKGVNRRHELLWRSVDVSATMKTAVGAARSFDTVRSKLKKNPKKMITRSGCVTIHFRRCAIQVLHTCTRFQMQSGWSHRVWPCILSPRISRTVSISSVS